MRILIVHNHYGHFATGGEGQVAQAEAELLRAHGHIVSKYEATNAEIDDLSLAGKCQSLLEVGWSKDGHKRIAAAIDAFRPDVMHTHNYWFRLTPSIFSAAKERGVATVLTLHNYRLTCPAGQFLRDGKPCELCMDGNGSRILLHRCYPGGSWLKSLLAYRLYQETQKRQVLSSLVDAYIAPTEFSRHKARTGGVPHEQLHVKPHFMFDPLHGATASPPEQGAIFVGRLSPEKGILGLLEAWRDIDYPLTIVGDGPQMAKAQTAAGTQVQFLGNRRHDDVLRLIEQSAFLVFPSECYEGFALVLIESMAVGRVVVASDLGPRREIVRDGFTGLLYRSGDVLDFRSKVLRLISDRKLCKAMGIEARKTYLAKYTPDSNYQTLIRIYEEAINRNHSYTQHHNLDSVGVAVAAQA